MPCCITFKGNKILIYQTVISTAFFHGTWHFFNSKRAISSYLLKAICLLILKITIAPENAHSQSYRTINYTVDHGLPSSEVYQVIQDRQGYIWFATSQGVSRFNGYEFQHFNIANGLPDNLVLEIYEDYKGRIWFIPLSCKLSYFYQGRIYTYAYNDVIQREKGVRPPVKLSFFVDKEENIYLSIVYNGLIRVSATGKASVIDKKNKHYMKYAMIFWATPEKALCSIIQDIGVDGFSIFKDNRFSNVDCPLYSKGTNRMEAIPYQNKTLVFYVYDLFIIENNKVTLKYRFESNILWLSKEDNGNIWVSVNRKGIYLFTSTDHFSKPDAHFLKGLSVSSVIKDAEGAYWFTTLEKGVFYMPSKEIKAFTQSDGIGASKITAMDMYQHKLWFAGNHSQLYNLGADGLTIIDYFKKPDCYFEFMKCYKDKLYMGGAIPGQFIRLCNGQMTSIFNNYFKNIHVVNDNEYYMLYNGIMHFKNDQAIKNLSYNNVSKRTYCMCTAGKDSFWVGTEDGLLLLNNDKLEHYGSKNNLFKFRIQDLMLDKTTGHLWIATKGGGLLIKTKDTVIQLTTQNGLPSNSLSSIYHDGNECWLGTSQGVAKLSLTPAGLPPYKITSYKVTDGLISNEVNKVLVKDSTVYLATNEGLCYFDKTKIRKNNVPPPIYIKSIKINDTDTSLALEYRLPYYKNNIAIEYIGLCYRNAGKIDYLYKMEGVDSFWRATQTRVARFPLLPPGKYSFSVKAINDAGVISKQTKTLVFIINKPYWQTLWFQTVVVLIIVFISFIIFYLINRIKIKELKKSIMLERNMNIYRQQALSSQMNPHFIFNSLNTVQKYILDNDKDSSHLYLSKIAKLMRGVLNNSQYQEITLNEELEALKLYIELEQARFSDSFHFQLIVDGSIDTNKIKIPPLILQPYVENAIHHGLRNKTGCKELLIMIGKEGEYHQVSIEDNGVGRTKANEIKSRKGNTYKSLGTQITNNRLEVYKKLYKSEIIVTYTDLTNEKGLPNGTRVIIKIKET